MRHAFLMQIKSQNAHPSSLRMLNDIKFLVRKMVVEVLNADSMKNLFLCEETDYSSQWIAIAYLCDIVNKHDVFKQNPSLN